MRYTTNQANALGAPLAKEMFGEAVKQLTGAGSDVAWGCDVQNLDLVNVDRAITRASRGLQALKTLYEIINREVTVNLSLSDDANGMAESVTPVLATESPVIRALPVTDKITPIVRMPHPLQLASAAS